MPEITQLDEKSAAVGTDHVVVDHSGTIYKLKLQDLQDYLFGTFSASSSWNRNNNTATINVSKGPGYSKWTYQIGSGTEVDGSGTSATVSDSTNGAKTVTVRGYCGTTLISTVTTTYTVAVPSISVSATGGQETLTISKSTSNTISTDTWQYSTDNGSSYSLNQGINTNSITLNNIAAGTYNVKGRVRNSSGTTLATSTTKSATVTVADTLYTADYTQAHSTNPKNVSGYGCLWNSDLGWSVYTLNGQLYIAIGMLSTVNHGSATQLSIRNATPASVCQWYNDVGWGAANSIFVETIRLPLTTVGTWVYGVRSTVIWPSATCYVGGSQWGNWFGQGVHKYAPGYDASNEYATRYIMRAKLETNNRITVDMNSGRYGTGDTGSSMTLNALNCCFNIITGRANGTALSPFTFSYA